MNKIIKIIISILGGMWITGFLYSFFYFFITGQLLYLLIFSTPTLIGLFAWFIYEALKIIGE